MIPKTDQLRILGVHFNPAMNFCHHVKLISESIRQRARVMYQLKGASWGANTKSMEAVFKCYLDAKMSFALGAIYPFLDESDIKKLNVSLNIGKRAMITAPTTTRLEVLRRECGTLSMPQYGLMNS